MKNLIRLESIGTALNMNTGMTHPINADGTIDFDEGMAEHILYDTGGFDEDGFELYNGLSGLYSMFANETLLLIFWLHFLSISLFAGAWIVRDSKKYFIPKIITIPSLIFTYFTGPIGLVFYWFIRIFFAKKVSFDD